MTTYTPRATKEIQAVLWSGSIESELSAIIPSRYGVSVESERLVISDGASTRWFVQPRYFVYMENDRLKTLPEADFLTLYREA